MADDGAKSGISSGEVVWVPGRNGGRLRPWQKGQPGNPLGSSAKRRNLQRAIDSRQIPRVTPVLDSLYAEAMDGNMFAAKLWLEQVRPMNKDTQQVETAVEKKLAEMFELASAVARKRLEAPDDDD